MAKRTTKTTKSAAKARTAEEHNILAALCYLVWPLALILLVIEETKESKKDRHLRHHAYNGMGFALAWFFILIIIEALSRLLFSAFDITMTLFTLAVIIIALVFAYRAYRREEVVVPFITQILEKGVKDF